MAFRITGLSAAPFKPFYGLTDDELSVRGVKRYLVDSAPGYPDHVEMRDPAIVETVLLLNHICQPAETPYLLENGRKMLSTRFPKS